MAYNITKFVLLCAGFMENRYFPNKLLHISKWHCNLARILKRTLKSLGYFQVKKGNFQEYGKIH